MSSLLTLLSALCVLWAGLVLGGSFVAAPAKFRAPSLTMSVALEVGRAQFRWLGMTEAIIAVALTTLVILSKPVFWVWVVMPIGIFVIQRLVIMPPLDARTRRKIAGETVPNSHLHVIYVVLEGAKIIGLIMAAWLTY